MLRLSFAERKSNLRTRLIRPLYPCLMKEYRGLCNAGCPDNGSRIVKTNRYLYDGIDDAFQTQEGRAFVYKLLLVDDELNIQENVWRAIHWEQWGFEVVGRANHGAEGLELAEKLRPDVVLTDIRMPYIDGLEMARRIAQQMPYTKFIILSGFDEFEYAKQAIHLSVLDYVLKPITSQELLKVLSRAREQLDQQMAERRDIQKLRRHFRTSLPLLIDQMLSALITGRLGAQEAMEKAKRYELDLTARGYQVAVAKLDASDQSRQVIEREFSGEMELVEFSALNLSREVLGEQGIAFLHNSSVVLLLLLRGDAPQQGADTLLPQLETIRLNFAKYLGIPMTIGVGRRCRSLGQVHASYEQALDALDNRAILGGDRVIFIEDMEPARHNQALLGPEESHELIRLLKTGTAQELENFIDDRFAVLVQQGVAQKDYRIYIVSMLTAILRAANDLNIDVELSSAQCRLLLQAEEGSARQVREQLRELAIGIQSAINRDRSDSSRTLVSQAVEYIGLHYDDSTLNVEALCQRLHISTAYFSTIFKKEMKQTVGNYLTQVRMEAAHDLLIGTTLKSTEIADRTGYTDPNYFSYCFKKRYGISPTEYRRRQRAQKEGE